jgi:hypothetical protein
VLQLVRDPIRPAPAQVEVAIGRARSIRMTRYEQAAGRKESPQPGASLGYAVKQRARSGGKFRPVEGKPIQSDGPPIVEMAKYIHLNHPPLWASLSHPPTVCNRNYEKSAGNTRLYLKVGTIFETGTEPAWAL